MGYMCLFRFWFSQVICLGVALLSHTVVLFPVFKGLSILSFIEAVQFTFLPLVQECSLCSISSPAFIVCRLFDDGHSDQLLPDLHRGHTGKGSNPTLLVLSSDSLLIY